MSTEEFIYTGKDRHVALSKIFGEQTDDITKNLSALVDAREELGKLRGRLDALDKKKQLEEAKALREQISTKNAELNEMEKSLERQVKGLRHLFKANGKRSGAIGGDFADEKGFQSTDKKGDEDEGGAWIDNPILVSAALADFFAKAKLGKASDGKTDLNKALEKMFKARTGSFNIYRDLFVIYAHQNNLRVNADKDGKPAQARAYMKVSPEMEKAFKGTLAKIGVKDALPYGYLLKIIGEERVKAPNPDDKEAASKFNAEQAQQLAPHAAVVSAAHAEIHTLTNAIKLANQKAAAAEKAAKAEAHAAVKAERETAKAIEAEKKAAEKAAKAAEKAAAKPEVKPAKKTPAPKPKAEQKTAAAKAPAAKKSATPKAEEKASAKKSATPKAEPKPAAAKAPAAKKSATPKTTAA